MTAILDSPYWQWFGGGSDTGAGSFYSSDPIGPGHYPTAADVLRQAQARNTAGGLPVDINRPVMISGPQGARLTSGGVMTINDPSTVVIQTPVAAADQSLFPLLALGVLALLILSKRKER